MTVSLIEANKIKPNKVMAQYHDAESAMDIDAFMALVVEELAMKKYGFWTFDETEVFLECIYTYGKLCLSLVYMCVCVILYIMQKHIHV